MQAAIKGNVISKMQGLRRRRLKCSKYNRLWHTRTDYRIGEPVASHYKAGISNRFRVLFKTFLDPKLCRRHSRRPYPTTTTCIYDTVTSGLYCRRLFGGRSLKQQVHGAKFLPHRHPSLAYLTKTHIFPVWITLAVFSSNYKTMSAELDEQQNATVGMTVGVIEVRLQMDPSPLSNIHPTGVFSSLPSCFTNFCSCFYIN
jgi:hypothetical protein